jgi:aminopeptidase N
VAGDFVMAGQWYPKLAVYDRGAWDTEPWHANAEFFHDFGSYTLALTVPSSYVTGATGTRQSTVVNQDNTTTVSYWADSVSDVAWTAWPGYRMASTVVQAAGRPVELELLLPRSINAAEDARYFSTAQQTLDRLGRWFGEYPWPKLTLVVPVPDAPGADGMEYPMLVTLSRPLDAPFGLERGIRLVEVVTVHEIAHQWVPLQLATNEAREAWLDEGFADYATTRVLAEMFGPHRSMVEVGPFRLGYEAIHRAQFLLVAVKQPLDYPSWEYPDFLAYGATVYSKGTLTLFTLERSFGADRFLPAMKQHFDRWRWRHPTAADLQQSLEAGLGTNLDAYFQPLVYGTGVVEYAVGDVRPGEAVVERHGDVRLPVEIQTTYADGRVERTTWTGVGDKLDLEAKGGEIRQVQLDPDGKLSVEPTRLDDGREVAPSPLPLMTLAARLLGLMQTALLAAMLG